MLISRLAFSLLRQESGWEERLRNDLFCVGWDVKPLRNDAVSASIKEARLALDSDPLVQCVLWLVSSEFDVIQLTCQPVAYPVFHFESINLTTF